MFATIAGFIQSGQLRRNIKAGLGRDDGQDLVDLFFLFPGHDMFSAAMRAKPAYETLADDGVYRRDEEIWLNADIDQARDDTGGIIGVESGQHEMAGERSLDGDFGCFQITDFSDHDDVRILA